jgi:hypothetical protein
VWGETPQKKKALHQRLKNLSITPPTIL